MPPHSACELYGACVAKATDWTEQRVQQLVANFHLHWHEDADLLAVDSVVRQGSALVRAAEEELGPLPVCSEILQSCEQQLRGRLVVHIRRANRHELRMIYADFCQLSGREELQHLCLDKYREQVDKHVQSEAVATQLKLQAVIATRSAATLLAPTGAGAGDGSGGGNGSTADSAALVTEDGEVTTVQVLSEYLEGVAGLKEELHAAELPTLFETKVLREVEQEACTQALELSSHVLQLDTQLFDAAAAVQQLVDEWRARGADTSRERMISDLDRKLEEASGMLQLLQGFAMWCDGLPSAQEAALRPTSAANEATLTTSTGQPEQTGDDIQPDSQQSTRVGIATGEGVELSHPVVAGNGKEVRIIPASPLVLLLLLVRTPNGSIQARAQAPRRLQRCWTAT